MNTPNVTKLEFGAFESLPVPAEWFAMDQSERLAAAQSACMTEIPQPGSVQLFTTAATSTPEGHVSMVKSYNPIVLTGCSEVIRHGFDEARSDFPVPVYCSSYGEDTILTPAHVAADLLAILLGCPTNPTVKNIFEEPIDNYYRTAWIDAEEGIQADAKALLNFGNDTYRFLAGTIVIEGKVIGDPEIAIDTWNSTSLSGLQLSFAKAGLAGFMNRLRGEPTQFRDALREAILRQPTDIRHELLKHASRAVEPDSPVIAFEDGKFDLSAVIGTVKSRDITSSDRPMILVDPNNLAAYTSMGMATRTGIDVLFE